MDHLASIALTPNQNRADEPGDNDRDNCLESVTLRLLDALTPTPQVLEIGSKLSSILLLDAERSQYRHNHP
jgi:hypothetical protein